MADHETGADNAQGWFIMLCVFAAICVGIWYVAEYQIKNIIRWFRYAEIWAIEKVFWVWKQLYQLVMGELPPSYEFEWNGQMINFDESYPLVPQIPQNNLDNQTMGLISSMAMEPLKYPVVICLIALMLWSMLRGPRTYYRRKMGLNDLIREQAKVFPVVEPFVEFNPSKLPVRPPGAPVPAELPEFSEALGPEEWLAYYEIPLPDGKIDRNAASKAFIKQLGGRWRGAMKLQPYHQILLAGFCLKAARKRQQADDFLGRLAMCWSHKKGLNLKKDPKLLKEARRILNDKKLSGSVLSKCAQHAWVNTAMMRGLVTAREEGGVLAPAQFVWLRSYDRGLWYPLNNVGRQSLHMEAIGAHSHYKMEKLIMRPIPKPRVDDAVDAISEYMESDKARPVPALDYTQSKKKRSIKKPT